MRLGTVTALAAICRRHGAVLATRNTGDFIHTRHRGARPVDRVGVGLALA
jgi:hypothetical protein